MKRYVLTLNLKDDPELIASYDLHHQNVWPEILLSIKDSGISSMEIYRLDTRLCMIMETLDDFSLDRKTAMDLENPIVRKWEELMWTYQQAIPGSRPGEKWKIMDLIFRL
jgi:L-rhamnose mutarotase